MKLKEFLRLEQPEAFDFKNLMKDYYIGRWSRLQSSLDEMAHSDDIIKKWYLYKTADREFKSLFDCDCCELAKEIYQSLWGGWGPSLDKQLGPDAMNSFAYTFGHSAGGRFQSAYNEYLKGNAELRAFSEFAQWTGCIGNFVLVPYGYNRYRGSNCCKDYWDLSLHNLKYNCDNKNWLKNIGLSDAQYVNMFFLWDYVLYEDGEYKVKRLFQTSNELWNPDIPFPYQNVFPGKEETKVFLANVNTYIKSRGEFMVKMLRYPLERYREIQEHLSRPDTHFASLRDAVEKIEKKFPCA